MIELNSSALHSVAHEVNSLFVLFNDGRLMEYLNVPKKVFLELLESESVGRFFNLNVRNKYKVVESEL